MCLLFANFASYPFVVINFGCEYNYMHLVSSPREPPNLEVILRTSTHNTVVSEVGFASLLNLLKYGESIV